MSNARETWRIALVLGLALVLVLPMFSLYTNSTGIISQGGTPQTMTSTPSATLYGWVYYPNGSVASFHSVNITHDVSGETLYKTTNVGGQYSVEVANDYAASPSNGDQFTVWSVFQEENTTNTTTVPDVSGGVHPCNLTLQSPPPLTIESYTVEMSGTQAYFNGTSSPPNRTLVVEDEGVEIGQTDTGPIGEFSISVPLDASNHNITLRLKDKWDNPEDVENISIFPVVSTTGGTVYTPDGLATLYIPPGALAEDVLITVQIEENNLTGSPVYDFQPDGLEFQTPATLTVSYDPSWGTLNEANMWVGFYDEVSGAWKWLEDCVVDTTADTISVPVEHFTAFAVGTTVANGTQMYPEWTTPGHNDIPILQVNITNNEVGDDTLLALNITSSNTDDADVTNVSLWQDNGNGNFSITNDTHLATAPFSAGTVDFTGLNKIITSSTTERFYITYNVSDSATDGNVLDGYIATGDLYLENASSNIADIDPVGNTTVNASSLQNPYVLYGYTWNATGSLANITLNITNTNTGEYILTNSGPLNQYQIELDTLALGYTIGDTFQIFANDTASYGLNTTTISNDFGTWLNISLELGPIASNPVPPDDNVSDNKSQMINLTVMDNSGSSGVDPTTIILEVDGQNYTIDGSGNLTYNATTGNLTFNTTNAGITWASDYNVNITLWQANDTIGNPCQNAPYKWNFTLFYKKNYTIMLYEGFSLISLPCDPSVPYTAKSLGDDIISQVGGDSGCQILGWNPVTQSMAYSITYNVGPGWLGIDFNIEPGSAYWIKMINIPVSPSPFNVTGIDFSNPVPVDLYEGFSLVSVPESNTTYTAKSLGDDIIGQVGGDSGCQILGWNPVTQSMAYSITYNVGPGWLGIDFNIEPGRGYWIKMINIAASPSTFTPV